LLTVGKYTYPNQVTFAEALKIAQTAVTQFNGKMSNKDVAEALGYKIKDPTAISGYIFRKFDDLCAYNLMKRQRGFVKVTDTALEALDPYDTRKVREGKAKAIRQIPIVNEAFAKWSGELPSETAFPSKLTEFEGISWQDAQKHTETLRKLFAELFPYLKETTETGRHVFVSVSDQIGLRDEVTVEKNTQPQLIGELRTQEYGILKLKDKISIDIAIRLLESLRNKLSKAENEKTEPK
jgi:hypothetical protein